jgi:hypothetical protein
MIRKSGSRFSDKIMLQEAESGIALGSRVRDLGA